MGAVENRQESGGIIVEGVRRATRPGIEWHLSGVLPESLDSVCEGCPRTER